MIYAKLTLLALVVVYIVGLSGFTDSWRGALARMLGVKALRPLPPFDCSKCAVWWSCLIYALCVGELTLPVIAFAALLSFMSIVAEQLLLLVREAILNQISKRL